MKIYWDIIYVYQQSIAFFYKISVSCFFFSNIYFTSFFYKQHLYKQREAEIGKKSSKC